jgi:hypothetical protein
MDYGAGKTKKEDVQRVRRRKRRFVFLGTLGALGCLGVVIQSCAEPKSVLFAPAPSPTGSPYLGPLRFNWKVGCAVGVRETVEKKGVVALLSYKLRTAADGPNIKISFLDFKVESIESVDGERFSEKKDRSALRAAMLDFTVSRKGEFVGLANNDAYLSSLTKLSPKFERLTPGTTRGLLENVSTKYWQSWVGAWLANGPVDKVEVSKVVDLEIGDTPVLTDMQAWSLAAEDGFASLRIRSTLDPTNFRKALRAAIAPTEGAPSDFSNVAGERVTLVSATMDPKTMQPGRVRFEDTSSITEDDSTETRAETREWLFDWENTDCSEK